MLKQLNLLGFLNILWTLACCFKSASASRQLQETGLSAQLHVNATTFVHGDWIQVNSTGALSTTQQQFTSTFAAHAFRQREMLFAQWLDIRD